MEDKSIPILCPVCHANDFTDDTSEAFKIEQADGSTILCGLVRFECNACGHAWEENDEGGLSPAELAIAREVFPDFFANSEGEQDGEA